MKTMKQTLITRNVFALFLMVALAIGCAEPLEMDEPAQGGPVTLTTSVSFDGGTKALTAAGVKTFAEGDQIAVIYKNTGGRTVKAVSEALTESNIKNSGKDAQFTVTLYSPQPNGAVRYIYPVNMAKDPIATDATIDDEGTVNYDALSVQDGTLSYVANNLDLCTFDGTFTDEAALPASAPLTNRLAVCKVFYKYYNSVVITPIDVRSITDGTNTYTVNGGSDEFIWVAVRPVSSGQTLEFSATKGEGRYYKKVKVTDHPLEAGHIYTLNVNTARLDGILLAGKFTVNASGKQVYFSKGNLQYTAHGNTYNNYYHFAEHQWDYIGNAAGNTTADGRETQTKDIDLFGWGASLVSASYTPRATCYRPWENSMNSSHYFAYGSEIANLYDGGDNAKKADWGHWGILNGGNALNYWRTLKNYTADGGVDNGNEWEYILNIRVTGNTVNSTPNARYTMATINTDETEVNGLILFPDNYAGPTASTTDITWGTGTINQASHWGTKCTTEGWAALEASGCVFLPAAGYRYVSEVKLAGQYGLYWSSSCNATYTSSAYGISFGSDGSSCQVNATLSNPRRDGYAVRLVKDVSDLDGFL